MAAEELVELVQEGSVLGLLQVGLWDGTLEHLEGVGGRGERGGLGPGWTLRETKTCCEEETKPTN